MNTLQMVIISVTLIAIAVVFAWAVLNTGISTSDRSRELIEEILADSTATLVLRGAVLGTSDGVPPAVRNLKFTISSGGKSYDAPDLSVEGTVISYLDRDQAMNVPPTDWSSTWLIGSGPNLDGGELVEISIELKGLSPTLGAARDFAIRVHPLSGSVLMINRTTPGDLTRVVSMTRGSSAAIRESLSETSSQ